MNEFKNKLLKFKKLLLTKSPSIKEFTFRHHWRSRTTRNLKKTKTETATKNIINRNINIILTSPLPRVVSMQMQAAS